MGDLKRTVWQGQARAYCGHPGCGWEADGTWPKSAGARARSHARAAGHTTRVRYEHTTEYVPQAVTRG